MSTVDEAYERGRAAEKVTWIPALSWQLAGLAGVLCLATALNVWNLADNGWGNTYYAAAVRSMTLSWHNFFFASYDPGGFITVDKPPVFLWFGAASARIFGYSSWSILLPSALAGIAAVGLLWLIVRRYFGAAAATIAGLALALTPITVAVDRLNLPEPFLHSRLDRRGGRDAPFAGEPALVGMDGAFRLSRRRRLQHEDARRLDSRAGVRAGACRRRCRRLPPHRFDGWRANWRCSARVTLVVSASWMAVVDAWPASQRPYVGGSTNNTELDLALGYNGFGRVDGESTGGGGGGTRVVPNFNQNRNLPTGRGGFGQGPTSQFSQTPGGPPTRSRIRPAKRRPATAAACLAAFAAPAESSAEFPASSGCSTPRMAARSAGCCRSHSEEGSSRSGGGERTHRARAFAVLFLGWVLLYGGVFSYAKGIYHSYYTSALAPGVAALVGIGAVALATAVRRDRRWLIAAAAACWGDGVDAACRSRGARRTSTAGCDR